MRSAHSSQLDNDEKGEEEKHEEHIEVASSRASSLKEVHN